MSTLDSRFLVLALCCASAVVARADDVTAAKAGMRERVAVIDQLKASGAVGEANTGMLAVRTPSAEAEQVVAAENADRAVVFAELAKRGGGTVDGAGRLFAKQMATASKPGVWLQHEDGRWYKK